MNPTMPITIRTMPIASRLRPDGSSVTPHARMAPAAIRRRLTGSPIRSVLPVFRAR
jgi:hypothetical protein